MNTAAALRQLSVVVRDDSYWTWLGSSDGTETGKYLFFAEDRAALLLWGASLIHDHGFKIAKVSRAPRAKSYVLCVYWKDKSRQWELSDLASTEQIEAEHGICYRHWKSDEETRQTARRRAASYRRDSLLRVAFDFDEGSPPYDG